MADKTGDGDDTLSRFKDDDSVKPISPKDKAAGEPEGQWTIQLANEFEGVIAADELTEQAADYKAKETDRSKAKSEENLDPVKTQQVKDQKVEKDKAEDERRAKESQADYVPPSELRNVYGKNEYVDLLTLVRTLRTIHIGAGWTAKSLDIPIDIDLSVFLLDRNEKTRDDNDFIFYNQTVGCDGAVKYEGDARTGAGEADDESMFIDMNGVSFDIVKIMFVLSVYDPDELGDHFGLVRNLYLRLVDKEYNEEICRFAIADGDEYKTNTGMFVAALVREGPRWFFQTVGTGTRGGLAHIATQYGIKVQELQSTET